MPYTELPPCCPLFALVVGNGTLVRGCGALSSARIATGQFQVTFARDVSECAYAATIGLPTTPEPEPGVLPPMGQIMASPGSNPNDVLVATSNAAGVLENRPFHLVIHCCPEQES
ncbi:MAG: hypothetical protein ACRD0K_29825 [Egibacteraceae bacterium]